MDVQPSKDDSSAAGLRPDAGLRPASAEPQSAPDYIRRDELARELVAMLDDEIRALRMRIGVLESRRKRIVRQYASASGPGPAAD